MYWACLHIANSSYRSRIRGLCCVLLGLSGLGTLYAQGDSESDATTYGQLWTEINSSNALTKKLTLQVDLQANFSNDTNQHDLRIAKHMVQYGGRAWLHYYLSPRLKLSGSLAAWHNPDVNEAGQYAYNEIRTAEQLTHYIVLRKATLSNRLRFEQRFLENEENTAYRYAPRIRFMPKLVYAINANVIREKTWYDILSDEIFMTPSENIFLRQNRLIVGLGYSFTNDVIMEIAYTNQVKFNGSAPNDLTNGLSLTLTVNNIMHWKRKKTGP